jgi:hypothetical protein
MAVFVFMNRLKFCSSEYFFFETYAMKSKWSLETKDTENMVSFLYTHTGKTVGSTLTGQRGFL